MHIRKIEKGQAELVIAAGHLFDRLPDLAATAKFLASETHHLFIAFEDERPVGFVSGVELTHPDKGTEMFLYELGVAEEFRRRGIGSALTDRLRELANERGCYCMWVLTDSGNAAALRTYKRSGSDDGSSQVMLNWDF